MGLTAKETTQFTKTKRVEQDELAVDSYPCRVAQVIDLGLQTRDSWNQALNGGKGGFEVDTDKAPAPKIMLTYEFTTEFMKDEAGNDVEDKPRWMSEDFHVFPLDNDLASSTKRYKGIDPHNIHKGNFAALANEPCTVTIGKKGNGKSKIGAVSPIMKGFVPAELKNPVKVFDLDNPDLEIFKSLPTWLQEKIQSNLEYAGSPLERLLGGAETKPKDDKPKADVKPQGVSQEPESTTYGDDEPW